MKILKTLRVVGVAMGFAASLWLMTSGALAASIYLCVPTKVGTAVKSGGEAGVCKETTKATYTKVALPSEEAEQQKLLAILPYIKYVASGVGGKPTIQFSGANVQILSGAGRTDATNGVGNLIIGYDEEPKEQTGSHNLILGQRQNYTSFAAVVGGFQNSATGPYSDVFGNANVASGGISSVTGGESNEASGSVTSVFGGQLNTASGNRSSVAGGTGNSATGGLSSVTGGSENKASGEWSSVSGGTQNRATGWVTSVSGGQGNVAGGEGASVGGGVNNRATGPASSVTGGLENTASFFYSLVTGGYKNTASGVYTSVTGGFDNTADFKFSSIFGGKELETKTEYEAIP